MRRASHPADELILVVDGSMDPAAVGSLCGRLRDVLQVTGVELVTCDVAGIAHPSAADIDAVARLQLTAQRSGRSITLRHASGRLRELLDLCGLQEVFPAG